MANRTYNQFQGTLEKGVVQLYLEVLSNGAADPTLVRGKGVASIVRDGGTGLWKVTLQDTYNRLLGYSVSIEAAGANNAWNFVLTSETVATTKVLNFTTLSNATTPAAVDPTSGNTFFIALTLSNSTAL